MKKIFKKIFNIFGYEIKYLTDRKKILLQMPKNSICAEIGVWAGNFSQEILETVK